MRIFHFKGCFFRAFVVISVGNEIGFLEIVMVMINWRQDFVLSNSVCNHTRDWHIGLELDSTQSFYHYFDSSVLNIN